MENSKNEKPSFERIMDAIGFVFVPIGGCGNCDATGTCKKVHHSCLCHDGCAVVCYEHNGTLDGCFKFRGHAVKESGTAGCRVYRPT